MRTRIKYLRNVYRNINLKAMYQFLVVFFKKVIKRYKAQEKNKTDILQTYTTGKL